MTTLDLTPDELLTTTRAVRKRLDFDRPVELPVVRECLEIAAQGPSGSNAQGWHFVVVTDPDKRAALGDIYRRAFDVYRTLPISAHALVEQEPEREAEMQRVVSSAEYLAANLGRAPVHVIPCITGRIDGVGGPGTNMIHASVFGSILPAAWSFMLAARARGLGTSWTTLHLMHEEEVAQILGIPFAEITQTALIPLAYTKGTRFKPAGRRPLDDILHVDGW